MLSFAVALLLSTASATAAPAKPDGAAPLAGLGGDWPAERSGKRVTLSAKSADQALQQIAAAAGWNLALNGGKSGSAELSLTFRDAPVEEALAAVLAAAQLSATRVGDTVVVTSATEGEAPVSEEGGEADDPPQLPTGFSKKGLQFSASTKGHGNRVLFGDVTIGEGERARDVVTVRGTIHLGPNSRVRDAIAMGGSVDLAPGAQVSHDAVAVGGDVHVAKDASVAHDAVSVGGHVVVDPGGAVRHDQTEALPSKWRGMVAPVVMGGLGVGTLLLMFGSALARFAAFFCLGAILLMVAPRQLERVESSIRRVAVKAGLTGFLGTLALPVLGLLLVITIIGIPLVAVEIFGVLIASVMGFTALALLIGRQLHLPFGGGELLSLAVGTAVIVILSSIPLIGTFAWITGWFVAFGGVLLTRFGSVGDGAPLTKAPNPLP